QCPGYGKSLTLTARKCGSSFPDNGVVTTWQFFDKLMCIGKACRRLNILKLGVGPPICDVLGDRNWKKKRLLKNNSNLITQTRQLYVANIMPVNRDRSFPGI